MSRHARAWCGCAAALAGAVACGAPAATPENEVRSNVDAPVVEAAIPPASSARVVASGSAARAPGEKPARSRITLAIPDDVACRFTGAVKRTTPLRFGPGDQPFGVVSSVDTFTAHVLDGDAARGIAVEAETKDVFVRGFARADDVTFHPTRVSVFGAVVMPAPEAPLHLVRAHEDGLELRLDLPKNIEVVGRKSLVEKLSCSITSLDVERFNPWETYFGRPIDRGRLRGSRIAIAARAADRPVATLVLDAETPREVAVLGSEGQRVKIAWEVEDVIAFGWVDARSVLVDHGGGGRGEAIGLGSIGTVSGCCAHVFVCDHEVPFQVTVGDRTETVGVARRGARIRTYGTGRDGAHELHPTAFDGFKPGGGVRVFVDSVLVDGCNDLVRDQ